MKVLTGNRLSDGEVVWYAADGSWVLAISGAEIAESKEDEGRLEAIGRAAYANNLVLDLELIEVSFHDGDIVPVRLREKIRARGPTIRLDLGKQAQSLASHSNNNGPS